MKNKIWRVAASRKTAAAMSKIWVMAAMLLGVCGCAGEDDADYYPVGNVNIERGGAAYEPAAGAKPVVRCCNSEDYVLDTLAQYPGDPTLGKLTFMFRLKNAEGQPVEGFNGIGKSDLTMSLGYWNGNYAPESQTPVYTSPDPTTTYAVRLHLKGELSVSGEEWMIDFAYAQLASLFQPYPPADFPEVLMCKGGELGKGGEPGGSGMSGGHTSCYFDSSRRTWTFDITYNRSLLSFSQLYYNVFVNLAGQQRDTRVRLRIDRESFFEIYEM